MNVAQSAKKPTVFEKQIATTPVASQGMSADEVSTALHPSTAFDDILISL